MQSVVAQVHAGLSGGVGERAVPLLGGLRGRSEQLPDAAPGESFGASSGDCEADLTLGPGALDDGPLEDVLADGAFIVCCWVVVLEAAGELVGVVENLLDRSWHQDHLRNLARAGMA